MSVIQDMMQRLLEKTGAAKNVGDQAPQVEVPVDPAPAQKTQLPEELQTALQQLLRHYDRQDDVSRREYIKRCLKARDFYRGLQWRTWDERKGRYVTTAPSGGLLSKNDAESADSLYVLNFYQAYANTYFSVITANNPTVNWFPMSSDREEDVKAAKAAEHVMRLFDTENPVHEQSMQAAYYLWCDGTFGRYIRYKVDGQKYGYRMEPVTQLVPQQIGPDTHVCPMCGYAAPMDHPDLDFCPQCNAPASPSNMQPGPSVMGMQQIGTQKIPLGQEVVDVVGGLELSIPPTAKAQDQFPYLVWSVELDKALVKATYPEVADKIQASGNYVQDPGDSLSRMARMMIAGGKTEDDRNVRGQTERDLVTFKRCWFRPWAFMALEDESQSAQLLQLFPNGVYVAFANDIYCESRPESMDDHWRICHAFPGDGQIREGVGAALISAQEIFNDLVNIERDTAEFGVSFYLFDKELLDIDKWADSRVRPGAAYNVKALGNRRISDGIWQSSPPPVSEQAIRLREEVFGPISQFLCGLFPAVYGGDTGGNDTAHGIAIERDQAMGRVALTWRQLKEHHAEFAQLVVKAFTENRDTTVSLPQMGEGGQFQDLKIDPNDLKNGQVRARPETNESYPTTWPQRKNTLSWLMTNPAFGPVAQNLENADQLKSDMGTDYILPGETAWRQQMAEIDELLKSAPTQPPPQMVPGPMGPMPMQAQPQSTVPIDPVFDDHHAHFQATAAWMASVAGQEAKRTNPDGFMNVRLHGLAHYQAMQPPPMPMGAPGAPPNGPEPPPPTEAAQGPTGPMGPGPVQ